VVISRLFKKRNAWKRSDSFRRDDLTLVAKAADLVHTWIYEQQAAADPAASSSVFNGLAGASPKTRVHHPGLAFPVHTLAPSA
jgi:hypothetical protein